MLLSEVHRALGTQSLLLGKQLGYLYQSENMYIL